MLKRIAWGLFAFAFLMVSAFLAWAVITVMAARQQTPELVRTAQQAASMKLTLDDLTPNQLRTLLKVQDPTFFEHNGIAFGDGTMTTITQSLVKQLYFHDFEPGFARIRQTLIARFALDPLVDKDTQLELFLNTTYLGSVEGRDIRGFAGAAQAYFAKFFSELSDEEFLALAAMLPAPNRFHPVRNGNLHARQMDRIRNLVAGRCEKQGLRDAYFAACDPGVS
ncbi:MAG: transglycosylase domain-containing protein [Alphaproteobacteria bacterium]